MDHTHSKRLMYSQAATPPGRALVKEEWDEAENWMASFIDSPNSQ